MQYTTTITKNDDATVTIDGTLSWEDFSLFEAKAFARLGAHLELPGFRKGHVPEEIAKKHLGDELILSDMAELAIQELYPTLLKDKDIDAIGRPALAITKLARGNELGFSIRTAILPIFDLPDYKTLAKKVPTTDPAPVTEEDVEKVIENLRHLRAYGHVHEEGHDHTHEEPLPEVNDEFAKSFGGEFASLEDLKNKIRENTAKEKTHEASDKRRAAILEAIVSETTLTVPAILTSSEQEKILAQIEMDISRSGLSMEDYLKHVGKTKEALLEEFKPEAEKRAKMQLIINAIAKKESITSTDTEVEERTKQLLAMYPGADKARSEAYADMVLTNEKVIDLLEAQK